MEKAILCIPEKFARSGKLIVSIRIKKCRWVGVFQNVGGIAALVRRNSVASTVTMPLGIARHARSNFYRLV